MSGKKSSQKNELVTQEEDKLKLLLEKSTAENEWLKKEINQRFSSKEHQTIAFMLGEAQLNLISGDIKFKDFSSKLFKIYGQVLKRKKSKMSLKFFEKVALLYVEEQLKKTQKKYVEQISPSVLENKTEFINIHQSPISDMKIIENLERNNDISELKQLRISSIMDEFTYKSYKDECEIDQLSIYTWEKQLKAFKPDIVFIESAWRGFNDEWDRKVATLSNELMGIIKWCRVNNVPTIFWNKEDPIHFQTFLNLAKEVDFVFTTDVDCIERYKTFLSHKHVYWLPFAAQPRVNNPIEKYKREDAFCFAGAYYVKYPERTADLNNFVEVFSKSKPVVIYDRNYYKSDENYKFPPKFDCFIKGNLAYDEIDKAYKGYNFSINLNSIKQSQSMFARRVFEVLASNTILVSNYSKGLRLLFGELIYSSDNADSIIKELNKGFENNVYFDYLKLCALRKVMSEHTYSDRLHYIADKALNLKLKKNFSVLIFSSVNNEKEYSYIVSSFLNQKVENKKLLILNNNLIIDEKNENIQFVDNLQQLCVFIEQSNYDYVGYFSPNDYYGEYYLYDLMLTEKYTEFDIVGKSKYYQAVAANTIEIIDGNPYTQSTTLEFRSSLIKREYLLKNKGLLQGEWELKSCIGNTISVDYFSYCKSYYNLNFVQLPNEIQPFAIDTGLNINEFERIITKEVSANEGFTGREFSALSVAEWFAKPQNKPFDIEYEINNLVITSSLDDGKHEYIYTKQLLILENLVWKAGDAQKIFLDITPGLNIQMVVKYIDSDRKPISHQMLYALKNETLNIPKECEYISIGFRLYGSGSCSLKAIKLYHKLIDPSFVLSDNDYLVVTNHYPSYTDLYKNGFVHSRVKAYLNSGVKADVFRLRPNESISYHEFEGIDVTTGSLNALNNMIANNHYKTIMVHFLDQNMWNVLEKYSESHKIIVWVHGAEIQAWHRRAFNYSTESESQKAKDQYEIRAKFWKELIENCPNNLHFVFVSNIFANEVMQDLEVQIPEKQLSIINNPISRDIFEYSPKTADMRKKILSIRPYASKTYANDLTVKAILELSKEPFFDHLEFRLIGSGPLFDEVLAPLKSLKNVIIENKFLTHSEIAEYHKQYGVFLCPSRMDTQGVSRDEAMSSGLVPITNRVGAIPEFLNDFQDLMVDPEDYIGLANVIRKLYKSPRIYLNLSKKVSQSILNRETRKILSKEVKLIES